MLHLPTGKNLSLLALITTSFVFTVLIILLPGSWFIQTTFEKKLVMQRLAVIDQINSAWTSNLNNHLNEAKKSIQRFSQTISNLSSSSKSETIQAFDSIVKKDEDGAWRSNQDLFSPSKDAGIWLQCGHPIRKGLKHFYIDVKETTEIFGQGALGEFDNTWLLPKEGGVIIYWPSEPEFIYKAKHDLDYTATEWVTLTKPDENPDGIPRWTPTSYDPAPGVWMISVVAPFFREGKWAGSVGHDLPISKLIQQMDETKIYQGTQQFLIRKDGVILISRTHADDIKMAKGQFRIDDIDDGFMNQYFEKSTKYFGKFDAFPQYVGEDENRIFMINHIKETDWFFISIVPRNELLQTVRTSYRAIWILGVFTLLLLALIPAVIISRVVVPPVNRLVSGIEEVTKGDLEYNFKVRGSKEFIFIATALNNMIAGIKKSVNEIKTAEEDLRESEQKYRLLLENIPQKIFYKDINSGYVSCNENYARDFKISPDEIPGKTDYDFYPEELADKYRADDHRIIQSERPEEIEEEYIQDGEKFLVQTIKTPVFNNEGLVIGLLGVFWDITKRKQIEESLKESEERYRTMADLTGQMVYDYYTKTDNIKWSGAITALTGYTSEEFLKVNITEWEGMIHRDDRKPAVTLLEEAMKKATEYSINYRFRHKNGSYFYVEDSGHFLKNEQGDVFRMVGSMKDITEKKLLEEQLRQSHKMEAIGTMAGGIAHEFNNILGIIVGNTELAMGGVPEWNTSHYNLKEIKTASLRARDIVTQILSFSRQTKHELKPVNIALLIDESIKFIRSSIPTTVEIKKDISARSDTINADPTQINQILLNLCNNAAHAMQEKGGVLEISLENVELDENVVKSYDGLSPGNHVKLTVSDTGHGIETENIEHIFDPFFTTKEVGKGTGMGLSVVHGIVKEHNGSITVQSEIGKGTAFHVLFPVIEEKAIPELDAKEQILKGVERILFVDDEESLVLAAKKNLEDMGYDVVTKRNPVKALELFKEQPDAFDLVITDMAMPDMPGDRLAAEIMKIRPDVPVIACTGYSDRMDGEQAEEMGIRAYIMKPYLASELATAIRLVLDRGKEDRVREKKRVLVVDDEGQVRSMLRQMLETSGYDVMEAPNGRVALWIFKEKPADLIITNLIMPGKEGIESIMELKRDFPDVKIIAISGGCTGYAGQYLDMAKKLGADNTLAKPFEKEELLKAVEAFLKG